MIQLLVSFSLSLNLNVNIALISLNIKYESLFLLFQEVGLFALSPLTSAFCSTVSRICYQGRNLTGQAKGAKSLLAD